MKLRVRTWVGILMFFGCFATSMMRVNYSVIMLEVVNPILHTIETDCPNNLSLAYMPIPKNTDNNHKWRFLKPMEVAYIFAAYDFGFSLSLFFSENFEETFGCTKAIGVGLLVAAIITMASPLGIFLKNFYILVISRLLIGVCLGHIFPLMNILMTSWSPSNERNLFGVVLFGSSIGAIVTLSFCGFIIENLNVQAVTYITGLLSMIWAVIWLSYVRDAPTMHRQITLAELNEIASQRISVELFGGRRRRIPWREVLCSSKIRALFLLMCCNSWNLNFFINYMPLYFIQMTRSTVFEASAWAAAPLLARLVCGIICLPIIKWMITGNRLVITPMRKCFTIFSHVVPGALALATIATNCIESMDIIKAILILGFNGAFVGGGFINVTDLTPNFANKLYAPMQSLITLLSASVGFVVAYIYIEGDERVEVWVAIMAVVGCLYLLGGYIYIIFGSASVQQWDISYARRAYQSVSMIYIDDDEISA